MELPRLESFLIHSVLLYGFASVAISSRLYVRVELFVSIALPFSNTVLSEVSI